MTELFSHYKLIHTQSVLLEGEKMMILLRLSQSTAPSNLLAAISVVRFSKFSSNICPKRVTISVTM